MLLRLLLFVVVAWLVGKILRILYVALTGPHSAPREKYGVGSSAQQPPAMEFKDVQDAEFEEIPDTKKTPK